jgi:hypothetical protein
MHFFDMHQDLFVVVLQVYGIVFVNVQDPGSVGSSPV